LSESFCCVVAVGDGGLNLSKNVLFLLNDVLRVVSDVETDDDGNIGNGILGNVIGFNFIRFEIIWNG